jgi:putative membrane protein
MMLLLRLALNAIALVVAAYLVRGIHLSGPGATIVAAVILGFVNAIVRPVLFFLTLPVTLVTLGLFIFVLNAACLGLTAAVVPGFDIDGFGAALLGAVIVSVVSWVLNGLVGEPFRKPAA